MLSSESNKKNERTKFAATGEKIGIPRLRVSTPRSGRTSVKKIGITITSASAIKTKEKHREVRNETHVYKCVRRVRRTVKYTDIVNTTCGPDEKRVETSNRILDETY